MINGALEPMNYQMIFVQPSICYLTKIQVFKNHKLVNNLLILAILLQ
jgi:hypothetical protein